MAIAYLTSVESTFAQANGGATPAVDTTGADLIVISVAYFNTGTGMSVQDSEGNFWTQIANDLMPSEIGLRWYYCIFPSTSATHTFTYNGTNVYCAIHAHAYTHAGMVIVYDKEIGAYGTGTSQAPGAQTPTEDNSLVITSQAGRFLTDAQSVDSSFTKRQDTPFVTGLRMSLATGDIIQGATASVNPTWSSAISDSRVVGQAAFYEVPITPTKQPLIIDAGVLKQLPSGDTLTGVVYADASLGPDNSIVRADGTAARVQSSSAIVDDDGALELNQGAALETSGAHEAAFALRDSVGAVSFEITAHVGGTGNVGFGESALIGITTGTKNLCIGTSAGRSISEGDSNICFGRNSGYDITTGGSNILMGASAGQNIVGGSRNIMMGESSGNVIVSGDDNIGFGNAVLASATGSDNVAIGRNAGRSITSGGTGTFIGNEAGYNGSQLATATNTTAIGNQAYTTASNQVVIGNTNVTETNLQCLVIMEAKAADETSGAHNSNLTIKDSTGTEMLEISAQTAASKNLLFGVDSGNAITTGIKNVCMGTGAGDSIVGGSSNMLLGTDAGSSVDSGASNVYIGSVAGRDTTSGSLNLALGANALLLGVDADYCSAVGPNSLYSTEGDYNTALGYNAGRTNTTGNNNLWIGRDAGYHASQKVNGVGCIVIGRAAYSTDHYQCIVGPDTITFTQLRGDVFTGDGAYETLKRTAKTADYTVVDETLVIVDATSNDVTITLPAAADLVDTPIHIKLKDVGSGYVLTIDADGAETIDGQLTVSTGVIYTSITVVSDGTEWLVI